MKFDSQGRELPDPTPVAMPLDCKRPESLTEQIRRMIRGEMSNQAAAEGKETFEEANDFEVPEEDAELTGTQYELMADELPREFAAPPRPRPDQDEDDDDDEADADSGSGDDDSGLSMRPEHDDPDPPEPPPSGTATSRRPGAQGRTVASPGGGGSGQPGRQEGRVGKGRPMPPPRPAKGKR